MIRKLNILTGLMVLASCTAEPASINVQYLAGKGDYTPQSFITVLNTTPTGSYVPIAELTATGSAGLTKAQLISALQQKAQALGANAIILTDESQTVAPDVAYNPAGGQYSIQPPEIIPKFTGLAIHVDKGNNAQN